LLLEINDLNAVLTEHLLHKLFVPLYIFSLTPAPPPLAVATQNLAAVLNRNVEIDIQEINNPRVSSIVALFLLSLVFLVITHAPLVHALAWVILNGDQSVFKEGAAEILNAYVENREAVVPSFAEPHESLEQALDANTSNCSYGEETIEITESNDSQSDNKINEAEEGACALMTAAEAQTASVPKSSNFSNITDEEKEKLRKLSSQTSVSESNRLFLDTVLSALDCTENDYLALLALCLIYAMTFNKGEYF